MKRNKKHALMVMGILLATTLSMSACTQDNSVEIQKSIEPVVEADSAPAADLDQEEELGVQDSAVSSYEYVAYSDQALEDAQTNDQKVVLFFHAKWCPSCRSADASFEEEGPASLPGVSVLKIDYDTATELKKEFGVIAQHTLVQIDPQTREVLARWSGGDAGLAAARIK